MTTNQPAHTAAQSSSVDVVTHVAKAYIDSLHRSGLTHNNWANLPNAQRSEIRHGMQSVVELLAVTGRLLADDETRFTAEQVEDVRRILSVVPTHRTDANAILVQAIASAHRLRSLLLAIDAADQERCDFYAETEQHGDLQCKRRDGHTSHHRIDPIPPEDAEDSVVQKARDEYKRSRLSDLPPDMQESLCPKFPPGTREYDAYARGLSAELDEWSGHAVAPAEPAEEESATETEWAIEFPGGICNISFDPADPEEMLQWIRDGKLVRRDVTTGPWIDASPSSVEPAEEGTKAEEKLVAHRDDKGDIYVGHVLVAFKHRSYEQIRRWFNEAHPGGISERRYRAVLHLLDVEASSPDVPAPTEASVIGDAAVALRAALAVVDPHEAGPWEHAWLSVRDLEDCAGRAEALATTDTEWPSLDAVPAHVRTVRDKVGDEYRRVKNGGWDFRSNEWQTIISPTADYDEFAPFVAVEEQKL